MMTNLNPLNIIFVEDSITDMELAVRELRKHGIKLNTVRVETELDFLAALKNNPPDLVISDYRLPGFDGMSALKLSLGHNPNLPFIILTGAMNEIIAVECMKAGATDYVIKEHMTRLPFAVQEALDQAKSRQAIEEAEEQLKESQWALDKAQEIARIGSWTMNRRTGIEKWSNQLYRLLGITPDHDTIPNRALFERFVHSDDLENVRRLCFLTPPDSPMISQEFRIVRTDGEIRHIWSETEWVTHGNGELTLVGIYQDITERKQIEDELIKAKIKAQENDKLKSAFLANMSHEIRTPMNGIIGFSEMMSAPDLNSEKRKYYAGIIHNSCHQLLSLINDIIDISKIETNQVSLNDDIVDLPVLLLKLFSFFSPSAKKNSINLYIKRDLDTDHLKTVTDEAKLNQIIMNLLGNALKFTRQGWVELGCRQRSDTELEFYVRDTGKGIRSENLEMIFERFRQEETSLSMNHGGTGLGLAISKAYVELLGGRIGVESVPDQGSTFHFTIPFKAPVTRAEPISGTAHQNPDWRDKTILIAEDEEFNLIYLEELLSLTRVKILHAVNGKEAVELCRSHPEINLVLMDIKMPVMNGIEALQAIHVFRPDLPIVANTAYAMSGDQEKLIQSGFSGYIAKPFAKNDLLNKISSIL